MDSGKSRQPDTSVPDVQSATSFDIIFMRRRDYLPLVEVIDVDEPPAVDAYCGPPVHERSKRWHSQDAFEMRRISKLHNKSKELIGYRPMIQQGHGADGERPNKCFRASDFGGSLEEALLQAKAWRDATESKLGIKPGNLRSRSAGKPWAGVSLIVSKSPVGRSYWGSNHVLGLKPLRAYIGKRSYTEAYHDLIQRIAERDRIPLPDELPSPPPPRADQYRRMSKAGLTDIPEPARRRASRSKN
ncbi:hypothetical protein PVE_R2G0295 [Pseudomonas veronii 1YdBTEX2]|uniref:Uncharacterized protein n=1 Tax=Pseudomonas veronii 1YdBTEX2 TaxID=1295141 RepID=A0A1D3K7J3_PSEVE|nr:hypothetical protein PVE_R2G0295 [Pseudomonas veronii 1YdBTEX2]